jgi:hypothetical protein
MQLGALILLHIVCLYFLQLLWKDKKESLQRNGVWMKMGYVSKRKSPRLFRFSVWIDLIIMAILYFFLIAYSLRIILQ